MPKAFPLEFRRDVVAVTRNGEAPLWQQGHGKVMMGGGPVISGHGLKCLACLWVAGGAWAEGWKFSRVRHEALLARMEVVSHNGHQGGTARLRPRARGSHPPPLLPIVSSQPTD